MRGSLKRRLAEQGAPPAVLTTFRRLRRYDPWFSSSDSSPGALSHGVSGPPNRRMNVFDPAACDSCAGGGGGAVGAFGAGALLAGIGVGWLTEAIGRGLRPCGRRAFGSTMSS